MPFDDAGRERLVTENLRYAYHLARLRHRPGMGALGLEDLEQEAVLGLMAAAAAYDVEEHPDVPFSAFARRYIKTYINEIVARWGLVRLDPLTADIPAPAEDPRRERLALEVWDMLAHVPPRCRPLLVRRYGLDDGPALGLHELSRRFGLPPRTVGRLLEIGRDSVREQCRIRGFSFESWAREMGKIA